jgi:hypothetical protein
VAATLPGTGVPTGTVAFKDGGTALTCTGGNQTLNASGVATCSVSFASYGNHALTATYAGATGYATSTSGAVTQKVVSSGVTGLVFTGIGGANTGSSCSGPVGSSYSCSVSAPSSATVSASVAFAGATGSPMVYSADPQTLGYTVVGKSTGSGSVTVTGATSTSSTPVSTTKQGSNSQTITVTFSDGLSSFTAVLTVN